MTTIIAHRGDPIHFRENTLPAFLLAESYGADMIELDVHVSKDGRCVVLHDDTLHRLWNVDAAVKDLTYEELRRATEGDTFEVPLLEDVIQAVHIRVMIDVKYANAILPIVKVLKDLNAIEQALFSGSNQVAHRLIRALLPQAESALTWNESSLPSEQLFAELTPNYLNPPWWLLLPGADNFQTLGPNTVKEMHQRGIQVSTWTVDEIPLAEACMKLGVDAIISNRAREIMDYSRSPERIRP